MLPRYEIAKSSLLIYTRVPNPNNYPNQLAYSAHIAISNDNQYYHELNNNYGVLFAASSIGEDNTIRAKGLKKPWLFRTADGKFGVAAIRVNDCGKEDEESIGSILLWISDDLIQFKEIGLVKLHPDAYIVDVSVCYNEVDETYDILWHDQNGNGYRNIFTNIYHANTVSSPIPFNHSICTASVHGPYGAINGNTIEIDRRFGDRLALKWASLYNTAVKVPDMICASSETELYNVQATAYYSDGSTAQKQVKWNVDSVNFNSPGIYELSGEIVNEPYKFPLTKGYGDPVIFPWNGKYYYIATNDKVNNIGLYVREADTPEELFIDGIKEHVILDRDESRGLIQTFWAPEAHVIGGNLYIHFAVSGHQWGPQCHMMKLKKNGRITSAECWDDPVRICKKDGSHLADDGITLDMTYFAAGGASYYAWSYRKNIGTRLDTGSMIFIATVDETEPWKLTSDPVLLSRPIYGWENINGTINNEGPYPLITDDFVYITYSGGSASDYTYAIGLLTARIGDNLLNPDNWIKNKTPVLSFCSMENVFGAGHNSFFHDPHRNLMIAYHAEEDIASNLRCIGIHRVHFNIDGKPVFDMSSSRDLNSSLKNVRTMVKVV